MSSSSAYLGDTVVLTCNTTNPIRFWLKISKTTNQVNIQNGYQNRFFISGNGTAISTLTITNIEFDDLTTFRCIDSSYDYADGVINEKCKFKR
jgi:hypothetical protein